MWCGLFNVLGTIHILFHSNKLITLMVHCVTGIIALLLYPTLGATGTLYKRREDVIKSYSKNLEELVAQKTKLLRKSEEKYRTLFEIVHTGMFRVTEDLKIVDINKYALDLIGLPYNEVIGQEWDTTKGDECDAILSLGNPCHVDIEQRRDRSDGGGAVSGKTGPPAIGNGIRGDS